MQNSASDNLLTTKDHWQHATGEPIATITPSTKYLAYYDKYLPKRKGMTAIEVGACPGSHLLAVALNNGYKPCALDYLPDVQALPAKFQEHGIQDLEVIETDFLAFDAKRTFDLVMSYGFIEHFEDPADIIDRHWKMVAPGGYLLLGVPILGPLQMWLRRVVLTPERMAWTLGAHNLKIMDVKALKGICKALPDCSEVVFAAHVRQMEMWFSKNQPYVRKERAWILFLWKVVALIPKWLKISCRFFSPYALVIVRRKGEA